MKCYEHYPSDVFERIDWKKPPIKPSSEMKDSHAIATTVTAECKAANLLVTGGKDGMIIVRSADKHPSQGEPYEAIKEFSAHSVSCGGVIDVAIDQTGQFVYSAGGDGSILIHSLDGQPLPKIQLGFENDSERNELARIREMEPQLIEELKTVHEYMIDEFQKANDQRKKNFK